MGVLRLREQSFLITSLKLIWLSFSKISGKSNSFLISLGKWSPKVRFVFLAACLSKILASCSKSPNFYSPKVSSRPRYIWVLSGTSSSSSSSSSSWCLPIKSSSTSCIENFFLEGRSPVYSFFAKIRMYVSYLPFWMLYSLFSSSLSKFIFSGAKGLVSKVGGIKRVCLYKDCSLNFTSSKVSARLRVKFGISGVG